MDACSCRLSSSPQVLACTAAKKRSFVTTERSPGAPCRRGELAGFVAIMDDVIEQATYSSIATHKMHHQLGAILVEQDGRLEPLSYGGPIRRRSG